MKLNYETCLVGTKVILVPYRPEHVHRYHAWMTDEALLHATGSEPLSLEQEYEMQASWRDDPEKCTFIVLARDCVDSKSLPKATVEQAVNGGAGGGPSSSSSNPPMTESAGEDERQVKEEAETNSDFVPANLSAMVGDVNLFLSKQEEDDGSEDEPSQDECSPPPEPSEDPIRQQAEIDIMIAEKGHQGNGLGKEACLLMMLYGAMHLNVGRFFCKINEDNKASIALFCNKLGFEQCNYAECFRQVELELKSDDMIRTIETMLGSKGLRSFGVQDETPLITDNTQREAY